MNKGIKIEKRKEGGYQASIISKFPFNSFSAFGNTPLEAQINVFAIRNAIRKEELKTNVIWEVSS